MPRSRRLKNSRPKKEAFHVKVHAQRRAKERYNLDLTPADFDFLHSKIKCGNYIYSEKQSDSRTLKLLSFKDLILPVIYDHNVNHISTFLPIEVLDELGDVLS